MLHVLDDDGGHLAPFPLGSCIYIGRKDNRRHHHQRWIVDTKRPTWDSQLWPPYNSARHVLVARWWVMMRLNKSPEWCIIVGAGGPHLRQPGPWIPRVLEPRNPRQWPLKARRVGSVACFPSHDSPLSICPRCQPASLGVLGCSYRAAGPFSNSSFLNLGRLSEAFPSVSDCVTPVGKSAPVVWISDFEASDGFKKACLRWWAEWQLGPSCAHCSRLAV